MTRQKAPCHWVPVASTNLEPDSKAKLCSKNGILQIICGRETPEEKKNPIQSIILNSCSFHNMNALLLRQIRGRNAFIPRNTLRSN